MTLASVHLPDTYDSTLVSWYQYWYQYIVPVFFGLKKWLFHLVQTNNYSMDLAFFFFFLSLGGQLTSVYLLLFK